ncbi:hypothetical protein J7T55_010003 [Diaporthe amygdali]|uniref:uncharacterized protein n=1 Tax=Phomopsis amygdali TaxID=1214568 RepID=UPI0022FE6EF0|nr:uncharacterized protein J7T55_010003 [Diaporthe amygdali]KAJ0116852.1 hypothetical protein J7T55_010003 [Diaporthe amygdali]
MKTYITAVLAAYLAVASAAPAADDGCDVAPPATTPSCTTVTQTVLATNAASMISTLSSSAASVQTAAVSGTNVQKFTGTLGGAPPPVVSSAGDRPFSVNGDTFVGSGAALGRSCDVQHNACANAANSGQLSGGVQQCDQQNQECHSANSLKKRYTRDVRPALPKRAALDLGSCSNANILFEAGLDGRNTEAFIAANQQDFNHGSALNIAVIAGFICQRLGSPCNAPSNVQQSCAQASSAAVAATQNQAAADAWNAIMGDGSVGGGAAASAPAAAATPTPASSTTSSGDDTACDVEPAAAATPTSDVVLMTVVTCN